ncbi:MAG: LuxR family transcriptional regulator [Paracoccaceae bacterium]|jgi:LuxR family transcriptional regulator|nr:LuxR family transcriptional regulator [Paracoccaceae bacterium]MDP7184362.1 LuxR family transcriptional regulator [Paracoccaceae bacterium]
MDCKALLELTKSASLEHLWDTYTSLLDDFGFDRIIYGRTRFSTETNLGDPSDFLIMSNHDPDYMEYFVEQGNFRNSPMLRWSLDNVGCASWSTVSNLMATGELSDVENEIVLNNRKYGVEAGYTVSFPTASRRKKSSASLTAKAGLNQDDVDRIWSENEDLLELLNFTFDLKVSTLPHYTGQITLTKRQREVLEWIGDGKTTQDTATILGLTPATVEKHLRLARETLHVDTTAQAVMKAAFLNQMFVIEN